MTDENREVTFIYGETPPRPVPFVYPEGDVLVAEKTIVIDGHQATLWACATDKPIKSGFSASRQIRRHGILIRGKRAAYEVSTGLKLRSNSAMTQVFGELRVDDIEAIQRAQDKDPEQIDEAQLIYKADRSGLNEDHPLVRAIYEFLDTTFSPLVATLETKGAKRNVSPDLRRQLSVITRLINQAVAPADPGSSHTPGGHKEERPGPAVGTQASRAARRASTPRRLRRHRVRLQSAPAVGWADPEHQDLARHRGNPAWHGDLGCTRGSRLGTPLGALASRRARAVGGHNDR